MNASGATKSIATPADQVRVFHTLWANFPMFIGKLHHFYLRALCHIQKNQDATVFVGNLDIQVDEELLWELMVQVGPIASVYMPKDPVTNQHKVSTKGMLLRQPTGENFLLFITRLPGLWLCGVSGGERCRICHQSHEHGEIIWQAYTS